METEGKTANFNHSLISELDAHGRTLSESFTKTLRTTIFAVHTLLIRM